MPRYIITTLLSVCLALGFASQSLRADTFGLFTFTDDGTSITITGYPTSASGPVSIPDSINSKSVTAIGNSAFQYCSGLTSVTIPSSVTSIGDYAFQNCRGLTSVTIPSSVTSIGNYAFHVCNFLTSVTIPSSVTSIGNYAFRGCSRLTSVTIPGSVTVIGDSMFEACSGLTSVTIPGSVTSIGNLAFYNCSGLTSVTIPSSVTSIGGSAFTRCSGLTNVTIPNSVTSIGYAAFADCTSLSSVTIPNSVTSIENLAFYNCSRLTSVAIPGSVSVIGDRMFYSCTSLTSVIIPNSVTYIGPRVFSNCTSLTSAIIPNSVTSIGLEAFFSCTSLSSVTIPGIITSIGDRTFYSCSSLSSVTIPNSVTSIGIEAFCSCSSLTSVAIPGRVTSIGSRAFALCSSLSSVTIPNSVTSIGIEAFNSCSRLTSVGIPSSVTSIGDNAFNFCTSLTRAVFQGDAPTMGTGVFDNTGDGFKIYYVDGKVGFYSIGYPTAFIGGEIAVEQPVGTVIPDPGTQDYGSVLVGTDKSLTFTIRNSGTGNLTGIALTADGANPDDFTATTTPADTVAPGESATFVLKFTPGASGSRSAVIHIASSDSSNNPFNITVSGTGTAPAIAVEQPVGTVIPNPGTQDYGSMLVGSGKSLTFTLKNTGTANLTGIALTKDGANPDDFTATTTPADTVAPGGSTTFVLKFTPGASGSRSAVIHIASSDSSNNPFNITVSGTGTAPAIAVEQPVGTGIANPGTKDYGSVLVGSGKGLIFTLKNTGTANLTGITLTKDGTNATDFTVTGIPAITVVPGGSTTFVLKFTPGAVGGRSAVIHIASSDSSNNLFNITVSGIGTAPAIAVEQPVGIAIANSGSKDYGSVLVGSGKSLTFTLKNTGTGNLTGIAVTKGGVNAADFTVTAAPAVTLAPSASTLFMLKFTPGAAGSRIAVIHIASSDSTKNPFNVNLTGTGTAPAIVVEQPVGSGLSNPDTRDYGSVLYGSSKSLTFTIRNSGTGNLTGIGVTKNGVNAADFTVTTAPSVTLAPGASTLFMLKFTPSATGSRTSAIHITSSDSTNSPFNINLTGTGTAPAIAVEQPAGTGLANAGSKDYGSVLYGSSKSLTFTIRNSGTGNLTGIAVTKGGVNAADFTVTAAPAVTLVPGASTLFMLKFTPGATGSRTAVIHIASSDSTNSPFNINLTGTGTTAVASITTPAMAAICLLSPTTTTSTDRWTTQNTIDPIDGLNYLTLVVTKAPGTAGQRRVVEVSSNLMDWYSGGKYTSVLQNDETLLKVRDNMPLTPGTKRYIRLK